MSKRDKAVEVLEFNKGMQEVHVTSDKQAFVGRNSAVNYSVKNDLKVEEIEVFDRSILEDNGVVDLQTYDELKAEAKALGFEGAGNPKKADLIEFIESKKED